MSLDVSRPLQLANFAPQRATFLEEVQQGLRKARKELPCKYFYDEYGSRLFDQICDLEEYYPTRTELDIMGLHIREIVALLAPNCLLIEYGSGSSTKTRTLLDHLPSPAAYVPIEISKEQLISSAAELAAAYPDLEVLPVCADFTRDFELPEPTKPVLHRVIYYPGSSIGNFDREGVITLLKHMTTVGQGGGLLIGIDLKKDPNILHRAYNDQRGVTAEFNLNLLRHINRELDADFQLDQFQHYAFYNPTVGRIEMHLVSLKHQSVRIGDDEISFALGESIWTESSYKYTLEEFAQLAAIAGFKVEQVWTDSQALFSVQYLTVL